MLSFPFAQVAALQKTACPHRGRSPVTRAFVCPRKQQTFLWAESSFFRSGFAFEQWQKERAECPWRINQVGRGQQHRHWRDVLQTRHTPSTKWEARQVCNSCAQSSSYCCFSGLIIYLLFLSLFKSRFCKQRYIACICRYLPLQSPVARSHVTTSAPNTFTSQMNISGDLDSSKVGTIQLGHKGKMVLHSIAKERAHRIQTVARTVVREHVHSFAYTESSSGYKTERSWICLHTDATDVNLCIAITDSDLVKKIVKGLPFKSVWSWLYNHAVQYTPGLPSWIQSQRESYSCCNL